MNRRLFRRASLTAFSLYAIGVESLFAADPSSSQPQLAYSRKAQGDEVVVPSPKPDPINSLVPAPVPNSQPLPPQPMADPVPGKSAPSTGASTKQAPSGGANYTGPLGSDFVPPEKPKKLFLGDGTLTETFPNGNSDLPHGLPTLQSGKLAPPPGTLGFTYRVRSRELDKEKHPRVGIVEVHLSDSYEVSAKGLKTKWTGKAWRLESDPLLPGIPHIYHVKAEWGPEDAKNVQVRTVRLIPDRIVDLKF